MKKGKPVLSTNLVQLYMKGIVPGATLLGQDGDVEDELCETEEEEPKPKEPKKDKCSKNSRGLVKGSNLQGIHDRYLGVLEIMKENQCSLTEAM